MTRDQVRERLEAAADPAYREFQSGLVPDLDLPLLGVRMPVLRALGRTLARENWREWLDAPEPDTTYEEVMLRGIVIAQALMEEDERWRRVAGFVPRIHNWAVCDCFCSSFGRVAPERLAQVLPGYLASDQEFEARFGIVMALRYWITADRLAQTMEQLAAVPARGYNARMAAAWALAECCVKFPQQGLDFLERAELDEWTRRKALQKFLESRRPDAETRARARALRDACPRAPRPVAGNG